MLGVGLHLEVETLAEGWPLAGVLGVVLDKSDLPQGSELGTLAGPSLLAGPPGAQTAPFCSSLST